MITDPRSVPQSRAGRTLFGALVGVVCVLLMAPQQTEFGAKVALLAGERTPNLPLATGGMLGLTLDNATPAHVARATVEGVLCGLADALDALAAQGANIDRVRLVGGAAASPAIRAIAPQVFGVPVPPAGEYVADGAARQAALALTGTFPTWPLDAPCEEFTAAATPHVRERYVDARTHWLTRN